MFNVKTILAATIAATISFSVNAAYLVKVPLEVAQGGSLPTGSIQINSNDTSSGNGDNGSGGDTGEPTTPTEPEAPEEQPLACDTAMDSLNSYAASIGFQPVITNYWMDTGSYQQCFLYIREATKITNQTHLELIGNMVKSIDLGSPYFSLGVRGFADGSSAVLVSDASLNVEANAAKIWAKLQ